MTNPVANQVKNSEAPEKLTQRRRMSHHPTFLSFLPSLAIGFCLALVACSGPAGLTGTLSVEMSATNPQCSFTAIGETLTFRAVVRDRSGNTVTQARVTWGSSDPSVISVTPIEAGALVADVIAVADGTATLSVFFQEFEFGLPASVNTTCIVNLQPPDPLASRLRGRRLILPPKERMR